MKISFGNKSGDRKAYRAKITGLHVKIAGKAAVYAAKDLSPSGVGLSGGIGLRKGDSFSVNLFYKGALVAGNLSSKVVRCAPSFTGLTFVNLDRRQTDAVHKLVLQEQKRQAEERKKDKLKNF